jgi:membrane protein
VSTSDAVKERAGGSYVGVFRETLSEWSEDNATRLGAALAYYAVFSIAPLLLIAITLAGAIFGEDAARNAVEGQLAGAMGRQAAEAVQSMLEGARIQGSTGWMPILGVLALIFGATGVFGQLQDALNIVWGVERPRGVGIWHFVRGRFLSIVMVLGTGFLLLVSLVLSAAVAGLTDFLEKLLPIPGFFWQLLAAVLSFAVVTVLFAMIFKFLPDTKVRWRQVWVGAALTAALFTLGKLLLSLYLGRRDAASAYGAAGALVLVLMWVYYSSLILLFGAEFTEVYGRTRAPAVERAGVPPER